MTDYLFFVIILFVLGEVKTEELGENLALGGLTYSSGDHWGFTPSRAVDGNTNQNMFAGSCFHSQENYNIAGHPWWVVKMNVPPGKKAIVSRIRLAVRSEDYASNARNRDFQFRVGDTFNPSTFHPDQFDLCHEHLGQLPLPITMYTCDQPLAGVYFSINIPTPGTLQLCEVEVYAPETPETLSGYYLSKESMEPAPGVSTIKTHHTSSTMRCMNFCNLLYPWCKGITIERLTSQDNKYRCVLYDDVTSPLVVSTTKTYYVRG